MFYVDRMKRIALVVIAVAACGLTYAGAMGDHKGSSSAERGGGRVFGSTGRAERRGAARRSEMAVDGEDLAGVHMPVPALEGMRVRREFIEQLNGLLPIMRARVDGFDEKVRQLAVDYSRALQIKQRQINAAMDVDAGANGDQDAIRACAQFELNGCALVMHVVQALFAFSEELRRQFPAACASAAAAAEFERLHRIMGEDVWPGFREVMVLVVEIMRKQINVQTEAVLRKNDEEAHLEKQALLAASRREFEVAGMPADKIEREVADIGKEFDKRIIALQAMSYEQRVEDCYDECAAMKSRLVDSLGARVHELLSGECAPISEGCAEFLKLVHQFCGVVLELAEKKIERLRRRLPAEAERLAQELTDLVGGFGRLGVDAGQPSGSGQ